MSKLDKNQLKAINAIEKEAEGTLRLCKQVKKGDITIERFGEMYPGRKSSVGLDLFRGPIIPSRAR